MNQFLQVGLAVIAAFWIMSTITMFGNREWGKGIRALIFAVISILFLLAVRGVAGQ